MEDNIDIVLQDLQKKLILTPSEKKKFIAAKEIISTDVSCLIGKVICTRKINTDAFKDTVCRMWNLKKGLKIMEFDENVFLFQFPDDVQKDRIMRFGPRSFDNNLLLLTKYKAEMSIEAVEFNKVAFWVRVVGLPIVAMKSQIGTRLANTIGSMIKVDADEHGMCWGRFLRVRSVVDISKPLQRGVMFQMENCPAKWISFEYECLPTFCYICGIVGHAERDCLIPNSNRLTAKKNLQYGSWLRASSLRPASGQSRLNNKVDREDPILISSGTSKSTDVVCPFDHIVLGKSNLGSQKISKSDEMASKGDQSEKMDCSLQLNVPDMWKKIDQPEKMECSQTLGAPDRCEKIDQEGETPHTVVMAQAKGGPTMVERGGCSYGNVASCQEAVEILTQQNPKHVILGTVSSRPHFSSISTPTDPNPTYCHDPTPNQANPSLSQSYSYVNPISI